MSETSNKDISIVKLPVLLLRGLVLFPNMILNFDVGRAKSIAALDEAINKNQRIFIITQKDVKNNDPDFEDLYEVGVIANIKQVVNRSNDLVRVLVEGEKRAKIIKKLQSNPLMLAEVQICEEEHNPTAEEIAAMRIVKSMFDEYVNLSTQISPDFVSSIVLNENPKEIVDMLASNIVMDYNTKNKLLSQTNVLARLKELMVILANELNVLEIEEDLNVKLMNKIEQGKREYYLREQMQVILEELGDNDLLTESESLRKKILSLKLPKEVSTHLLSECNKLSKMPLGAQEANVYRNYIDLCINLPWKEKDESKINLKKAEEILNKEHYGLDKVKERILETIAVKKFTSNNDGQILCLVGPPGVGKTSIAKSIAHAMNRKYARISLGGIHDESDIRGHRRTYVGAMPGRIISAINKVQKKNPVLLLDEIDKLSKDVYGDPVSALLEVLDPEQNNMFYDHYVDMPFDLSEVFFITTANNYDNIPRELLDRMEIINLTSYTSEEKFNIAKKYIIPKQIKNLNLKSKNIKVTDSAIKFIIDYYTKESGVRTLDRTIATLFRKLAKNMLLEDDKNINVTSRNIEKILGPRKFKIEEKNKKDEIGIVNGLAWTSVGGEVITIEVAVMQGTGKVEFTGSLGEIMRESIYTVISFIRSNSRELGVNPIFYTECDIHVHIPQAAVPKDGPSAGISLATAIISALTDVPISSNVAMTGEITLRGKVLPIGGLKEKTMAAYRSGITTVIIPEENKSDLSEISQVVKDKINFIPIDNIYTALEHALLSRVKKVSSHKSLAVKKSNSIIESTLNVLQ